MSRDQHEHPRWCNTDECSFGRLGGAHVSAPRPVEDNGATVAIFFRQKPGARPLLQLAVPLGHPGWSLDGALRLAEAIRRAAVDMQALL